MPAPARPPARSLDRRLPHGISVIVPCYHSEGTLGELARRLNAVLGPRGLPFEIIFVNDCSRDGTWNVIADLAKTDPSVRGIDLFRNFGQHNALLCGLRTAKYDTAVTLDDDLQNPPEEIPKLLAKLEEGFDVVYGAPAKMSHGLFRNFASEITKIALKSAMGSATARHVSAFRVFRTRLRDAFEHFSGSYVSIDVLLTWGSQRFAHIEVRHEPRTVGTSNYTLRKLIAHATNMITGFSVLPLQVSTVLGFALTSFGFAMLVLILVRFLLSDSAPAGFPFLASLISIFSGAQLFSLGVIGEYLARMHFRMMEKPTFVVRDETPFGDATDGGPS